MRPALSAQNAIAAAQWLCQKPVRSRLKNTLPLVGIKARGPGSYCNFGPNFGHGNGCNIRVQYCSNTTLEQPAQPAILLVRH